MTQDFFFTGKKAIIPRSIPATGPRPMERPLETVALFSLKLAYETEGQSPILRDDMVMGDYQRDVFAFLVRKGDLEAIKAKIDECIDLAMDAIGGADSPMGRELQKLALGVQQAHSLEQLNAPLLALKDYLHDIL